MTNSEKLARWQGWKDISNEVVWVSHPIQHPNGATRINWPDYPNDDAAAMSLLDTLVKNGLRPELWHNEKLWQFEVWERDNGVTDSGSLLSIAKQPTRREAVVAACLEVARKELNA